MIDDNLTPEKHHHLLTERADSPLMLVESTVDRPGKFLSLLAHFHPRLLSLDSENRPRERICFIPLAEVEQLLCQLLDRAL
jgi:hypothetical protein